jgi:hypothetical protein
MRDVTPILGAAARSTSLSQFLLTCPTCRQPCAVHVDESGNDGPVVVRSICPDLCVPDLGALVEMLTIRYAFGAPTGVAESSAVA